MPKAPSIQSLAYRRVGARTAAGTDLRRVTVEGVQAPPGGNPT